MGWIIMFCAGAFVGFLLSAIIIANSRAEELQEVYNKGFEDGKKSFEKYN